MGRVDVVNQGPGDRQPIGHASGADTLGTDFAGQFHLFEQVFLIDEKEATAYLFKLDRLGLIELHSGNRIRLLVSDNAFWKKGGPFAQSYHQRMTDDFLEHDFHQLGARRQLSAGQLSDASLKLVLKKVDGLIRQFNELADMDTCLPLEVRRCTGLFIGFRPWVFTMISDLRRQKRSS